MRNNVKRWMYWLLVLPLPIIVATASLYADPPEVDPNATDPQTDAPIIQNTNVSGGADYGGTNAIDAQTQTKQRRLQRESKPVKLD